MLFSSLLSRCSLHLEGPPRPLDISRSFPLRIDPPGAVLPASYIFSFPLTPSFSFALTAKSLKNQLHSSHCSVLICRSSLEMAHQNDSFHPLLVYSSIFHHVPIPSGPQANKHMPRGDIYLHTHFYPQIFQSTLTKYFSRSLFSF